MSESISLYYKGCQLVAGVRDGQPVAYVNREGEQVVRIEGASVIDCARQATSRIDRMRPVDSRQRTGEQAAA